MTNKKHAYTFTQKLAAWSVHLFTASAAVLGLFTLQAIYNHQYILAFWLMGVAIFIDSVDGTLARRAHVKQITPQIDGTLLDNIVDYLNYVITPCFLLMNTYLLPANIRPVIISLIVLSSAYQFTQADAKTDDHFFKGFPSFWNFVVFYVYITHLSPVINALIIVALIAMVFVPIKYVYPSRMDHLTPNKKHRQIIMFLSIIYGAANLGLLITYPDYPTILYVYVMVFNGVYFLASLYRTLRPLTEPEA